MNAKILKIRYKSEPQKGGFFYILETDQGICKGKTEIELAENDFVEMAGDWRNSKFNGAREYLFSSLVPCLPVSPRARFDYACSITKGIGPSTAEKIWEALGNDWETKSIDDIAGISRQVKDEWKVTLKEIQNQIHRANTLAWLMQAGLTPNMSVAAWVKWGAEAAGVVSRNPYRLAELPHYGFATVDELVMTGNWGIGILDPRRVQYALLYVLDQNAGEGHTMMRKIECRGELEKLCAGVGQDQFETAMDHDGIATIGYGFGDNHTWIGRQQDYENELAIWERWR